MLKAVTVESVRKTPVRKVYERPAIVHSEKAEARAVLCGKSPAGCKGPAHS